MQEQKLKRNLIIFTVLSVVIIFGMVIGLIFQYAYFWSLKSKQDELNKTLEELQRQHSLYQTEYEYKSSEDFIEDYAREVLGWGKEGSTYYK